MTSLAATPLANAGTPLMWMSFFTLAAGNLVIGAFEAWLIGQTLGASLRKRFVGLMIVANYLSMLLALAAKIFLLDKTDFLIRRVTIENVFWFHLCAYCVALLLTVLVEWPFVALCIRSLRKPGRSMRVNLLVQAVSNGILLLLAIPFSASIFGYLRDVSVAPVSTFADPERVWIYYIADEDGHLWRTRPDGSQREICEQFVSVERPHRLFVQFVPSRKTWDLFVEYSNRVDRIRADFASEAPSNEKRRTWRSETLDQMDARNDRESHVVETLHRRDAARLQEPPAHPFLPGAGFAARTTAAGESAWEVKAGYWPIEGLRATHLFSRAVVRVALETTLIHAWRARYPVLLNRRQVVFQFGRQVVIADLDRRQIGLLARGAGLVVVEDEHLLPVSLPQ